MTEHERTIRWRVEAIEPKGLVQIGYPLDDLGQHTHCVYDFTPLRAALNAVCYSDHPEEQPTGKKCPVGSSGQKQPQPPDTFDQTHRTKSARPTGQKCPPNESIEEENRKKGFSPPASAELSQAKTSQAKTSQDKDET